MFFHPINKKKYFLFSSAQYRKAYRPDGLMNFYSFDDDDEDDEFDEDSIMSNEKNSGPLNKMSYMKNGRYICHCGKSYKEDRYMR